MIRVLSAEYVKSCMRPEDIPSERLPEIAIAGRSNVGKSSLINTLVNQKRLAITSSTPGRTRSVNYFRIRLSPEPRPPAFPGLPCYFVDLPGYGYAKVPASMQRQWQPMVESYLECNPWLRGVLILVDARRSIEDEERQLIEYLKAQGIPFQLVLTKSDKLSNNEVGLQRKRMAEEHGLEPDRRPIAFSTVKQRGAEELLECVAALITLGRSPQDFARES